MKRTGLLLACLVLARAAAADGVATVIVADDDLRLVRDGRAVLREIDAGFVVEHFDAFTTGPFGRLELATDPRTGIAATVDVPRDSAIVVAIRPDAGPHAGVIELASGSVAVRSGAGQSGVRVRSAALAAEARAAAFAVDLVPSAALVTADEGIVAVAVDDQAARYASPGAAVELDTVTGLARTVRYEPEMTAAFRSAWRAGRLALVGARADALLAAFRDDYVVAREDYDEAYARLMRHRDVIDRWVRASMRSAEPETVAEPASAELREALDAADVALLRYETIAANIVGVARVAAEAGTGVDLLQAVAADRPVAGERAATVRQALKLAARYGGVDAR